MVGRAHNISPILQAPKHKLFLIMPSNSTLGKLENLFLALGKPLSTVQLQLSHFTYGIFSINLTLDHMITEVLSCSNISWRQKSKTLSVF